MAATTVPVTTNPSTPKMTVEKLPTHVVKVFSATKMVDREHLGETVTDWLTSQQGKIVVDHFVVSQSSDAEFHCLAITVFAHRVGADKS